MRTKQNLSTITYNTIPFLKCHLEEWKDSKLIDFWAFVPHKKEADEKKNHIHLFIMPNKQVDTNDLDSWLSQPVKDSEKPLGTCSIWHTVGKNNTSDWLLYCLHDIVYCKLKGYNDRVYVYTLDDFYTSNRDGLEEMYFDALHSSKFYFDKQIRDKILESKDPQLTGRKLVRDGYIPLSSSCSFHHFLQMI